MNFEGNEQIELAYKFIQYTDKNIFLTGKAGTGKTTFLKFIRDNSPKRMVVVAPTGVAAINAGGMTIHSFFQLSFGPQLPEDIAGPDTKFKKEHYKFRKNKIDIIKSLDLLVIDEISMVRADLLDGIDRVLRKYRNTTLPFGGVQLLMIGDLQQLSPVAKEDEWNLLKPYYKTPYFFSSIALQKTNYVTIELKHVYRQKDREFIDLLNKIRESKLDKETIDKINERYNPGFDFEKEGYIILTTHNYIADEINTGRLNNLKSKERKYKAKIIGNFPEFNYPTEEKLILKKGAQVMFVKNDPSLEKLFYNGKIGKVLEVEKSFVSVICEGDENPIIVEPLTWEKTKYEIDNKTKEIKEEIEGTFTQMPLKLAWAITIHKSQGLTFDKVIIDANKAFAHGQVYVALSRCTSLEGIVLKTPVTPYAIKQDYTVNDFSKSFREHQPDTNTLEKSKKEYEKNLLIDLFNFQRLHKQILYLAKITNDYSNVIQNNPHEKLKQLGDSIKKDIVDVSSKFHIQLANLINSAGKTEDDETLQNRIKKGSVYFADKIKQDIIEFVEKTSFETDNKEVEQNLNKGFEKLYNDAFFKYKCLDACKNGFKIKDYLEIRSKALLDDVKLKKQKTKVVSSDVPHPELYNRLRAWRNETAKEESKPVFMVLHVNSIAELCKKLPVTIPGLKTVKGLGKAKVEKYGMEITDIISDYCDEYGIKPPEIVIKPPKPKKKDTKEITYELWKQGLSPEEIAEKREFAVSTIEGHLAHYVSKGEIDVLEFVDREKVEKISEYFRNSKSKLLSDAKEALGDEYSYNELRFVLNYLIFKEEIG